MLLRNASIWASSSFEDYTDKKWTDLDFTYTSGIHVVTINAICLQTSLKNIESFEMMKKLIEYLEKNPKLYSEILWQKRTVQEVCYIIQFRNCIRLGKIEDVKHFSRQMALIGIDPYTYSALHTELFDEL
jgi:hypothetical protein